MTQLSTLHGRRVLDEEARLARLPEFAALAAAAEAAAAAAAGPAAEGAQQGQPGGSARGVLRQAAMRVMLGETLAASVIMIKEATVGCQVVLSGAPHTPGHRVAEADARTKCCAAQACGACEQPVAAVCGQTGSPEPAAQAPLLPPLPRRARRRGEPGAERQRRGAARGGGGCCAGAG